MHTKPISTEVIASSEATSTRGFASLIIKEADTGSSDSKPEESKMFAFDREATSETLTNFQNDLLAVLNNKFEKQLWETTDDSIADDLLEPEVSSDVIRFLKMIEALKNQGMGETEKFDDDVHFVFQAVVSYPYIIQNHIVTKHMADLLINQIIRDGDPKEDVKNRLMQYFDAINTKYVSSRSTRESTPSEVLMNKVEEMSEEMSESNTLLGNVKVTGFRQLLEDSQLSSLLTTDKAEDGLVQETWETFINKLPLRSIIATMNQPNEERNMNEGEKDLLLDIDAVKCFNEKLATIGPEAASKNKPVLHYDNSEQRSITEVLRHYHDINSHFVSISACSHLVANIDAVQRREYVAQANDLIDFRNTFSGEGSDVDLLAAIKNISDRDSVLDEEKWPIVTRTIPMPARADLVGSDDDPRWQDQQ